MISQKNSNYFFHNFKFLYRWVGTKNSIIRQKIRVLRVRDYCYKYILVHANTLQLAIHSKKNKKNSNKKNKKTKNLKKKFKKILKKIVKLFSILLLIIIKICFDIIK